MTREPDDLRRRAIKAQRELEETNAAFETMRESAINAWLSSPPSASEFREELYRTVVAIDTVRDHLMKVMDGTKMADFADTLRKEGYQA